MCVSDLHLGALNSLLTAVDADGERVDATSESPVLAALCEALQTLRTGTEPPELIVLGDMFELALSTTADAAATFAQLVRGLRLGKKNAVAKPQIRFVAGNHDHHLWSRARGASYLEHISGMAPDAPLPHEPHTTRLQPGKDLYPVRDTLLALLAARADPDADTGVTVELSYPNLGIFGPGGERAVVLSHGHFIEPLYRAMSTLEDFRHNRPDEPCTVEDLEAENGAWIDFFWSSMGDSGDVGRWSRKLYESLQSDVAVEAEIDAIRRAISRRPKAVIRGHIEGLLLDGGLTAAVKRSMRRERHQPEVLSDKSRSGLLSYLSGPVANQLRDEGWSPSEVAFVFGHTHKPFIDLGEHSGLPGPGTVINTGGWVVDSTDPEQNKGASVILIDDDLHIAVLRCFGQGAGAGHQVAVEGPPHHRDNLLVREVNDRIAATADTWRALAEATVATESQRRVQLRERLAAQTKEFEQPADIQGDAPPVAVGSVAPAATRAGERRPLGTRGTAMAMRRLSRPVDDLEAHYDVVVVGSGYGGSIAACRLARAGQKVAVLERGRELHPGEYPDSLEEARRQVQTAGALGTTGDRRGLYWMHVGKEMTVFSGCGLGGTSLVNANVSLRPDPRVFEDDRWPRALRQDRAGLDAGFARSEAMLTPTTYPDSFPPLAKMDALRRAAGGAPCYPTPINVTFRAGPNAAGVHQEACTGCGDCVTGCNHGAKNTLLMNYLPDAVAHGAHIFTEMDVRWVEKGPAPSDGGDASARWVVRAQPLGTGRDRFGAPPLAISADLVVLAAGTLGSSGILFRSREHGLTVSDQLGRRFSGNGDVLGFAYHPDNAVQAVGAGPRQPDPHHPPGPCITAVIDRRGGRPLDDGIIIEDAVVPGATAGLLPLELMAQTAPDWARGRLRGGGPSSWLRTVVSGGRQGLAENLQTLLIMGNDDAQGTIVPSGDSVSVDWPGVGTSRYYEYANQVAESAASVADGTYLHDPLWSGLLNHSLITVHPLGGCVMADRAEDGVVDDRGQVYAGATGNAIHDGLVVWDGSIVARPLGVNPLLTISALTERAVAAVAAARGWTIDATPARPSDPANGPPPRPTDRPGLRFTERMAGYWARTDAPDAGDAAQFQRAAGAGEATGSNLAFELTLASDDVRAVVDDLSWPMRATGSVEAPGLSDDPLVVEHGTFRLLVADDTMDAGVDHMRYELPLRTVDGRAFHFSGFKVVARGDLGDLWGSTTTLYVTLRADQKEGAVVGRGVLHIKPADFARQLRTMKVTGPASTRERLELEARFGKAFAGRLYHTYGSVVHRSTPFDRSAPPRRRRPLDLPARQEIGYRTDDGVSLRLTRYQGGTRGPVLLVHGMGANPLTYMLDTIELNMVEYLVHAGFDVWLQEWRASTLLPTALSQFTADIVAHHDHPAAQAAVREHTGRSELHVVAHCVGSLTWMMSTLAGTTDPTSLVCSSVGLHPIGPPMTKLKAGLRLGTLLRRLGVGMLTTDSSTDESTGARLVDLALRAYPIPEAERCNRGVCRRLAFIYGIGVHHPSMNELTHTTLHELFGPTDMTMMVHLSNMAHAEKIIDAQGADRYLPHLERLRRPITLLSGSENMVWTPASTERTFALLTTRLGGDQFRRVVFDGYGHQDVFIGAEGARDTFPEVLAHLERVNA